MHRTMPAREIKVLFRDFFLHPTAEIFIGDEQNVFVGQGADDLHRVGGSHAHVRKPFERRRGIDVADDGQIGHLCTQAGDLFGARHVRHGAVRTLVGEQYPPGRIEDLRALPHEPHPAENDGLLFRIGRYLGKIEGIAHTIGDRLHFFRHVIMGQNDRVCPLFRLQQLFLCHNILSSCAGYASLPCSFALERARSPPCADAFGFLAQCASPH